MIRHGVDDKHLMPISFYDPCDVGVKPVFPFFLNEGFPMFYGKNDLEVDLGVGVGHGLCWYGAMHLIFMMEFGCYRWDAAMRLRYRVFKDAGVLAKNQKSASKNFWRYIPMMKIPSIGNRSWID